MSPASTAATRDPPRSTSTVPQAWTARSRRWVESRIVAPRARASAITSNVACTLLPAGQAAQLRTELEVLPRGRTGHQPTHVGTVSRELLDREGVLADV